MATCTALSLGLLARVAGLVLSYYANWLLDRIHDGIGAGLDFLADIREFGMWLFEILVNWCNPSHRTLEGWAN